MDVVFVRISEAKDFILILSTNPGNSTDLISGCVSILHHAVLIWDRCDSINS